MIASDRGAVPDFVRDGVNGLLYRAGNPGALAGAIGRVLDGHVAIPGRRTVLDASPTGSFGEFVGSMEDAYEQVMAGRR